MTLVAIHQPNFLPWLGYFDKVARADAFVLLDHVQFPKKGGTWINRVKMLVSGGAAWVTVPIDRSYHGERSIREMRIDESKPWREKTLRTIQASYGRAPHFDAVFPRISELLGAPTDSLAELNEAAIRALTAELGLGPEKLVRSSELEPEGAATAMLVSIVQALDGDAYLAGGGAEGYQKDERFAAAGIELVRQEFEPRPYPQPGESFVPGLSVVDALFNLGFGGTAALARG